jgi:hypothetical protein
MGSRSPDYQANALTTALPRPIRGLNTVWQVPNPSLGCSLHSDFDAILLCLPSHQGTEFTVVMNGQQGMLTVFASQVQVLTFRRN